MTCTTYQLWEIQIRQWVFQLHCVGTYHDNAEKLRIEHLESIKYLNRLHQYYFTKVFGIQLAVERKVRPCFSE